MDATVEKFSVMNWTNFCESIGHYKHTCFDPALYKRFFKPLKQEFIRFEDLNNHFVLSFFPKIVKTQQIKWHDLDKYILLWLIISYVESVESVESNGIYKFITLEQGPFIKQISEIIYFDEDFIRQKLYSLMNWKVKLDPWDDYQVEVLKQIVKKQESQVDWVIVTLEFNKVLKKVRYPKQLRERWNNVSNPQLNRKPFSLCEDIKLMDAIKLIPEQLVVKKYWSFIRKNVLNWRNDNQIKIRFHKIIKTIGREMGLNFKTDSAIYKIVKGIKSTNSFDPMEIKEYYTVKCEYEEEESSRMQSFQNANNSSYTCQSMKKVRMV